MAKGLYLTRDGRVLVDYGSRRVPISSAQYRANGYRPSCDKLPAEAPPKASMKFLHSESAKRDETCRVRGKTDTHNGPARDDTSMPFPAPRKAAGAGATVTSSCALPKGTSSKSSYGGVWGAPGAG